jgi:hypothetical protein
LSRRRTREADGITCALFINMDLDRRKHDVDIIERVLGRIRDAGGPEDRTPVLDVDLPWVGGDVHRTVELTIGIDDAASDRRSSTRSRRR